MRTIIAKFAAVVLTALVWLYFLFIKDKQDENTE